MVKDLLRQAREYFLCYQSATAQAERYKEAKNPGLYATKHRDATFLKDKSLSLVKKAIKSTEGDLVTIEFCIDGGTQLYQVRLLNVNREEAELLMAIRFRNTRFANFKILEFNSEPITFNEIKPL